MLPPVAAAHQVALDIPPVEAADQPPSNCCSRTWQVIRNCGTGFNCIWNRWFPAPAAALAPPPAATPRSVERSRTEEEGSAIGEVSVTEAEEPVAPNLVNPILVNGNLVA